MLNKVIDYYNTFDEWGRLDREPVEFIVNLHHILAMLPKKGHVLDNGAGPGKYSMELAKNGFDVTLTDLTPRLVDISVAKAKELNLEKQFKGFHSADAKDLSIFHDELFDASLMMGPLYHLQSREDRDTAVQELYRVTRSGGYVFVAFMTRIRHLMTSLMYPEHWKPHDHVSSIKEFMKTGVFNHSDEGRFTGAYYYNIEDIKPFMESHGFESIKLIASSSIAGALKPEQFDYWRSRGEEEFHEVMKMIYQEAENPSILGVSSHLLYIGRKRTEHPSI